MQTHPWVQLWWQGSQWPSLLGYLKISPFCPSFTPVGQESMQYGPSRRWAHATQWSAPCRSQRGGQRSVRPKVWVGIHTKALLMCLITGPVQLGLPLWGLHSGWQGTHSPSGPANSLGALQTRQAVRLRAGSGSGVDLCVSLPTPRRNYSCPHMCRLGCSSCRRDTGRAPGPSSLSPNTTGHTRGPRQLWGKHQGRCWEHRGWLSEVFIFAFWCWHRNWGIFVLWGQISPES